MASSNKSSALSREYSRSSSHRTKSKTSSLFFAILTLLSKGAVFMKSQFKGFFSGVLVTLLAVALTVSALAISGKMTIEVDPVNIQVNGEVFQPTDVDGNAVPVFIYDGTTYAPLRALAEAYGLEVGWDGKAKLATVTDPNAVVPTPAPDTASLTDYSDWSAEDEAAYQEFSTLWDIKYNGIYLEAHYCGSDSIEDFIFFWNTTVIENKEMYELFCCKIAVENNPNKDKGAGVTVWIYCGDKSITESAVYSSGNTYCFIQAIN